MTRQQNGGSFRLVRQLVIGLLAASAALHGGAAEDRTVTAADEITADIEYGRLLVNADLTVAAGVKLTCDTLCIASNIVGSATLTLEEGASLTVNEAVERCVQLGAEGGQARLVMKSGSVLTADSINAAYGYTETPAKTAVPTRSFVVVSNATINLKGTCYSGSSTKTYYGYMFSGGGNWPSGLSTTEVVDELRLDEGAVVNLKRVNKNSSKASAKILFNGGRLVSSGNATNYGTGSFIGLPSATKKIPFILESTNGCPVVLSISHTDKGAVFSSGSKECYVHIRGDGEFVKDGTTVMPLIASNEFLNTSKSTVAFQQRGACRIVGGGLQVTSPSLLKATTDSDVCSWIVENGASLDLNGNDAVVKSLTVYAADGLLNSADDVATLTVGEGDSDCIYPYALPPRVNVRKNGEGVLSLFADDCAAVDVQSGELKLMSRREIGYPFYKFNAYKTRSAPSSNLRLRIAEFKFLDGMNDVTQGWDAYYYTNTQTKYYNEPTNMWDGDLSTQFNDQRAQNITTISNIHTEVEYRPSRRITGYTWATSDSNKNSDPVSWEMFGSLDNENWVSLDLVEDFVPTSTRKAWVGTNFVFRFPETIAAVGALSVASGAKLTARGADLTLTEASFAEETVFAVGGGGSVALPVGTQIAAFAVDAISSEVTQISGFVPAASGVLQVTGAAEKPPRELPVEFAGLDDGVWSGWTVEYNGVPTEHVPKIVNGRLCLQGTRGLILLFR